MSDKTFKHVFGPVISRRLGRSLGVDVVPFKTCTHDCIYCQLGRTTTLTTERKEYVPLGDVLDEVRRKFEDGAEADYITLAGSGEPTLYSKLGPLISRAKSTTPTPIAVITNGSMLWEPEVQDALLDADLVMPSLDVGDAAMFARINRPPPEITFEKHVNGLVAFRDRFKGHIWLEIFLLHGLTAKESEVMKIGEHVKRIRPDRIQLNTVVRPVPDADLLPEQDMARFAEMLGPNAEVIAPYESLTDLRSANATPEDVLDIIKRHPCALKDIAEGLGIHQNEVAKLLGLLLERDAIRQEFREGVAFYIAVNQAQDKG